MSLNIGDALSTGADKLTTAGGIQLGVIYVVLQLLTLVGAYSAIGSMELPAGSTGSMVTALSLPIGVAGGAALALLGAILNVAFTIVALRALDHDAAELGSIPAGVADDMLKTWLFLVIAVIVQGLMVGGGYLLLGVLAATGIVPVFVVLGGFVLLFPVVLFLTVSLIFTQVYVAVEGEGPFEALSSSWSLASGNRFPLFGLGVVLFVISLLVSIPTGIVSILAPTVGTVLNYVVSGFVSIFTLAVMVDSYQQLEAGGSMTTETSDDGSVNRTDDDDSGFNYA